MRNKYHWFYGGVFFFKLLFFCFFHNKNQYLIFYFETEIATITSQHYVIEGKELGCKKKIELQLWYIWCLIVDYLDFRINTEVWRPCNLFLLEIYFHCSTILSKSLFYFAQDIEKNRKQWTSSQVREFQHLHSLLSFMILCCDRSPHIKESSLG